MPLPRYARPPQTSDVLVALFFSLFAFVSNSTGQPQGERAIATPSAAACSFSQPPQVRAEGCNQALARTINFGNMLDTPREGLGPILTDEYFTLSKQAGFTAVRLTIRWDARASYKPPYTIQPKFFERVDGAVKQATANGLAIIIDVHHYASMNTDPETETPRFLAQWKQIAEHYRDAPATVMFELLNEPNGTLTQEIWNSVLSQALEVIRASNPNRTLIVGGAQWNTRVSLETLALPADDRNLIATFHYYDPMDVTHQGADWVAGSDQWLGTTWKADAVNVQNVKDDFAQVATWAKSEGRPILLGEFGVYSKAGQATRVAWTRVVREQAEAHGFSWAYWELASSYGLLEPYTNNWRQPLVRALMPKSPVLASRY